MSARKVRLTVTVDRELVDEGAQAVAAGRADSLSAWVNIALAERAAKERRLAALGQVIADYEARHGTITADELAAQQRADRRNAIVVRASPRRRPKPKRRAA